MTEPSTSTSPMPAADGDLEQLGINVIRGLAMDAPRAANSGHPGTAMALAPLAHVLFTRVMRHDPSEPGWPDRDRFVLSNGHASILLYSMLYLTGYGLTLDDLRAFRQLGSRTPGHPELHRTPGCRGDHRPPGPGSRRRGGHGDRRALAPDPLLARGLRPPHLRHRRRRLLRGGHLPRGRLPGRPPRAGPAGLRLRRQPHHHRRPHRAVLHRRRGRALRRLRMVGRQHRRGGQRRRRPGRRRCCGPRTRRTGPR